MIEKMKSVLGLVMLYAPEPSPSPVPPMPPLPRANQDSETWRPIAVEILPRVEPGLHPDVGLTQVLAGQVGADSEGDDAKGQVPGPTGGDPEHADEQGEEQGGEPDVVLQAHHPDGEDPCGRDGHERARVERQPAAHLGRWSAEQLPLLDEVGGEEDAQQDLGQLHRLELDRTEMDPQPSTVDILPDAGQQGARSKAIRRATGDTDSGRGPGTDG